MPFWVWTLSPVWAGVLMNLSSWNGETHWNLQKNLLKPNWASHNTTSWHDIDRSLEHSPSRASLYYKAPALQKIILFVFFFYPTLYTFYHTGLLSVWFNLLLKYFIIFDAIENGMFLIILYDTLLLVLRDTTEFYLLVLIAFLLWFLGFSVDSIMLFTSLVPIWILFFSLLNCYD